MRAPENWLALTMTVVLAILASAACESTAVGPTPAAVDQTPSPYPLPVGSATLVATASTSRVCRAQDIDASWLGENGATMGLMLAEIALRNTSSSACILTGIPDIRLLDQTGNAVDIKLTKANNCAPFGDCPPDQVVELLPGLSTPTPYAAFPPGIGIVNFEYRISDGGQACPLLGDINKVAVVLPRSHDTLVVPVSSYTISRVSCGVLVHKFDRTR